jgi:hypothetical protein
MTKHSSSASHDCRISGPYGAASMPATKWGQLFARLVRSAVPSGCSTGDMSPRISSGAVAVSPRPDGHMNLTGG